MFPKSLLLLGREHIVDIDSHLKFCFHGFNSILEIGYCALVTISLKKTHIHVRLELLLLLIDFKTTRHYIFYAHQHYRDRFYILCTIVFHI